jgi:hypothetical protein
MSAANDRHRNCGALGGFVGDKTFCAGRNIISVVFIDRKHVMIFASAGGYENTSNKKDMPRGKCYHNRNTISNVWSY